MLNPVFTWNERSHKATIRPGGRDGSVERAGAAMSMLALAVRRGAHVFRDARACHRRPSPRLVPLQRQVRPPPPAVVAPAPPRRSSTFFKTPDTSLAIIN